MGYVKYIADKPPVQDDWWKTVSGRYKYPYEKRRDLRIFGTKRGRENYRHENDYQLMETLKSVVIVSMGFIALFVGLAKKSSKAAVVTSFLLIFLTQANVGDFTMANNAVFPVLLTFVSFGFAVLSVGQAENKDLM